MLETADTTFRTILLFIIVCQVIAFRWAAELILIPEVGTIKQKLVKKGNLLRFN